MAIDFSVPTASRSAAAHSLGFRPAMNSIMLSQFSRPLFGPSFFFEDRKHRPVELFCLRDAHAVHFKPDDREARPRKYFDDPARSQIWEFEIVGLDQDESFFH